MHDPLTAAFEIKYPWFKRSKMCPEGYHKSFITIWHKDPERRGSDDSCGWFKRAHHGDEKVLEKIVKDFDFDWDRTFKSDSGKIYHTGYFLPEDDGAGMPNMGVSAIVLNLFLIAASAHFNQDGRHNWKKARKFCQKHLFDILLFAENPTDSMRDGIVRKWGCDTKRKDRIRQTAACIYGWILRAEQRWWEHPRWHIHHWQLQIHPWQYLKRGLFERCCKCRKRFRFGESPITDWNGTRIWHDHCDENKVPIK